MKSDTTFNSSVSFNQQRRLVFEHAMRLMTRRTLPYHIIAAFDICGDLDHLTLERAVNALVESNTSLRCGFERTGESRTADHESMSFLRSGAFVPGRYRLKVEDNVQIKLHRYVASRDKNQLFVDCGALVTEQLFVPFRYDAPPLIRPLLIRRTADHHILVLIVHHMILDRWSIRILHHQLCSAYAAVADCHEHTHHTEPTSGIVRFARRQYEIFLEGFSNASVSFWHRRWLEYRHKQLGPNEFRIYRPDGQRSSAADIAVERLRFTEPLSTAVRACAKDFRTTVYVLCLTAYSIVLQRFTGMRQILIWSNFANRSDVESEELVGWLANSHVIGVDLVPGQRCDDLVKTVHATVIAAIEHQEVPLSLLWCLYGRSLANGFRTGFDFSVQDGRSHQAVGTNIAIRRLYLPGIVTNRIALEISATISNAVLTLSATYATNLFSHITVGRMLATFKRVLLNLVDHPRRLTSTA
jgi:hypothetical protein